MTTGDAPMPPVPVKHEVAARVECPDPDSKDGVNMVRDRLTDRSDIPLKLDSVSSISPSSTALHELLGGVASDFTDGQPSSFSGRLQKTELAHTTSATSQDFRTKIRVSYPNSCFYLDASPDDRINQLLQIIEKRISLSQESFYLTYVGHKLDPGSTLRELGLVVSLITFELHLRLRGGCPDKGNLSLREFIANNSVSWSTMSHGKKLYFNRLVKEVLVRYPAKTGMGQVVKLVTQPLAIHVCHGILHHVHMTHGMGKSWNGSISLETFRMIAGVMEVSQPAVNNLDETSVHEDYKQISKLFMDILELNKNHPIYLSHLCSQMKTADVTSAKSKTFQLSLRVHPSLMTYSTRSSLLWEMQREMDGLLPPSKAKVEAAINKIHMAKDWTVRAQSKAVLLPTFNKTYKKSSRDCFRFI